MKQTAAAIFAAMILSAAADISSPPKEKVMKINAGVITTKLKESKEFYAHYLGFTVSFENDFYVLMSSPTKQDISFLLPDHPSQQPIFKPAYNGKGMYITIEVDNVEDWYKELKEKKAPIKVDLREEPWGDTHFAIEDPNGIGIDIVTYKHQ